MKKIAGFLMAILLLLSQVSTTFAEDTLKQQIAALPSVEEFKAMTPEEQVNVYNRTQYAYAAYMDLPTAEEKAAIKGAEEKFDALFSHFNTTIMPLEEQAVSGKTGHNQFAWVVLLATAALLALPLLRKSAAKQEKEEAFLLPLFSDCQTLFSGNVSLEIVGASIARPKPMTIYVYNYGIYPEFYGYILHFPHV